MGNADSSILPGEESPALRTRCIAIIFAGCSGSGKSKVMLEVARLLEGAKTIEGDALHPPENIHRMRVLKKPLRESDRLPWLTAVRGAIRESLDKGTTVLATCSALKRAHRDLLHGDRDDVFLFFLDVGKGELTRRMSERHGWFAPELLDSQIADFEPPLPDEANVFLIDGHAPPAMIAVKILQTVGYAVTTISSEALLDQVIGHGREALQTAPLLDSFGSMELADLQQFARQHWLFCEVYPRFLAKLAGHCPDPQVRLALVADLVNESGGLARAEALDQSKTSTTLFANFCRAVRLTEHELGETAPLPGTHLLLLMYERLVTQGHFLEGLGAIALASECQSVEWARVLQGLRSRGDFADADLEYFALLQSTDAARRERFYPLLIPYLHARENRELVVRGVKAAVTARVQFWKSLKEKLEHPSA